MLNQTTLNRLTALCRADRERGMAAAERRIAYAHGIAFGVEEVASPDGKQKTAYVNRGDTYEETICFDGHSAFLSCWGDVFEQYETDYCENEGLTYCGYCGGYPPFDEPCHPED